jgi:arthrofactin-type cyclic lipopeptide synthetase C
MAYETALQLIGQDCAVDFLGLIDSPISDLNRIEQPRSPQAALLKICKRIAINTSQYAVLCDMQQAVDDMDFNDLLRECCTLRVLPRFLENVSVSEVQDFCVRSMALYYDFAKYVPAPSSIPLHVFEKRIAPASPGESEGNALGWRSALPEQELSIVHVPRNDHSDRHEWLVRLGEEVSTALAAAGARTLVLPERDYHPHVIIQTGISEREPIFCVPGAGDSVVGFAAFASSLGDSWPVHGLQSRGLDGSLEPHSTVEAAASAYVRVINEIRPNGPLHLVGHSFGGWVALELARQMRAHGRLISSLSMIDTEAPGGICAEYTSNDVVMNWLRLLEMTAERSLGLEMETLLSLGHAAQRQLLHEGMVRVGLMPRNSRAEDLRGSIRTFGAAVRTAYQPSQPYPEQLLLVLVSNKELDPEANQSKHEAALSNWRRWAPNLTYWPGPGNHLSILKPPCVQALAERWRMEVTMSNTHWPNA